MITITSAIRKNAHTMPALKIVSMAAQLLKHTATKDKINKLNFFINEYLVNK